MGKKKLGSRKEKKQENSFRRNIQSQVMPTILPLNPVHATGEKNGSDVIQPKQDKNITNISFAAFLKKIFAEMETATKCTALKPLIMAEHFLSVNGCLHP